MSEHLAEPVRRVPAEPDDPEFRQFRAEVESEFPVGPGEIREVYCEWFEYRTIVEDVDGVPCGVTIRRVPSVGGRIRSMTESEQEAHDD